jgi:general secretion pathway protein H
MPEPAVIFPHRTRTAGFTLIETIVVLVILGLGLSIAAGFLQRRNATLDLAGATEDVTGALRLARGQAMSRHQTVLFTIPDDGTAYEVDGVRHALPSRMAATLSGSGTIRFAPDGSSSGGSIRIVSGTRVGLVRIAWLTGRVTAGAAE